MKGGDGMKSPGEYYLMHKDIPVFLMEISEDGILSRVRRNSEFLSLVFSDTMLQLALRNLKPQGISFIACGLYPPEKASREYYKVLNIQQFFSKWIYILG